MGEFEPHEIVITAVNNGYIIRKYTGSLKATKTYIAFTFNELQQLVKKLLEKEDLPDIPF